MNPSPTGQTSPSLSPSTSAFPVAGITFWIGVQSALIALSAANIDLTAQGNHSTRALAPILLLIGQLLAAGILFPVLLCSVRSATLTIALAFLSAQMASYLKGTSMIEGCLPWLSLSLWLIALGLWQTSFRGKNARLLASGVAALYLLGVPLVWYLNAEFAPDAALQLRLTMISPLLLAANNDGQSLMALCLLHAMVAGAVALFFWARRQRLAASPTRTA